MIKIMINVLEGLISRLNNMSDRGKAILGYTVIGLALLGTIIAWLKITIWCIKYAIG